MTKGVWTSYGVKFGTRVLFASLYDGVSVQVCINDGGNGLKECHRQNGLTITNRKWGRV